MNDIDLSALDPEQRARWERRLQSLPPGIRDSLRKNLARVPAEKVGKILRDNEPMISRLEGKLGGAAQQASAVKARLPHVEHRFGDKGHYNNTVQRGDGHGLPLMPIIGLAAALALAVTWLLQALLGWG